MVRKEDRRKRGRKRKVRSAGRREKKGEREREGR